MMELNDSVIALIKDVVRLSYRIQEWWELDRHLQEVEASFMPFYNSVRDVTKDNFAAHLQVLTQVWHACHTFGIHQLDGRAQRLKHIHEPAVPGNANHPDLRVGIASLAAIGTSIQHGLNAGYLEDLKEQTEKFHSVLYGQLANRHDLMREEVDLLCQMTYSLRERVIGKA